MDSWLPPSRENWELLTWAFQWFPLVTAIQWGVDWFPMGKTSVESLLNMPGKWAWLIMESPGFLTLLYIMSTLPGKLGVALPWQNWFMAGLFVCLRTRIWCKLSNS
jgi:3-oxo-5-alpha-steroid 4-dehydrogenase 1